MSAEKLQVTYSEMTDVRKKNLLGIQSFLLG